MAVKKDKNTPEVGFDFKESAGNVASGAWSRLTNFVTHIFSGATGGEVAQRDNIEAKAGDFVHDQYLPLLAGMLFAKFGPGSSMKAKIAEVFIGGILGYLAKNAYKNNMGAPEAALS